MPPHHVCIFRILYIEHRTSMELILINTKGHHTRMSICKNVMVSTIVLLTLVFILLYSCFSVWYIVGLFFRDGPWKVLMSVQLHDKMLYQRLRYCSFFFCFIFISLFFVCGCTLVLFSRDGLWKVLVSDQLGKKVMLGIYIFVFVGFYDKNIFNLQEFSVRIYLFGQAMFSRGFQIFV